MCVYSHFEIGVIVKDLHCKTGIICDNYLFSSAHFEKSLYFYDSSAYFHTYCIFIHLENVTNVTVLTGVTFYSWRNWNERTIWVKFENFLLKWRGAFTRRVQWLLSY